VLVLSNISSLPSFTRTQSVVFDQKGRRPLNLRLILFAQLLPARCTGRFEIPTGNVVLPGIVVLLWCDENLKLPHLCFSSSRRLYHCAPYFLYCIKMLQYGKLSNKNEIYLLRNSFRFDINIFQLFSGQFDGLNQTWSNPVTTGKVPRLWFSATFPVIFDRNFRFMEISATNERK
jgi:hypothetical protein